MRTVPATFAAAGNSVEAWTRRVQSGSARALMARDFNRLDPERAFRLFAE
jgi:hypothetical protein